jgi:O-antigen/teichoic acid export membrane protein
VGGAHPARRPRDAVGSALQRLLVHASHYSLASLLTTLAGLVSFPLLTRIFSVADYGVMSLVAASVTIAVTFGKLGVQQTVLRYHSEIGAGKRPFTTGQLASTTLFGMAATGLLVAGALFAATRLAPAGVLGDRRVRALLALMCVAVVMQVVESMLVNFTRAEMRTKLLVAYQVAKRYVGLGLVLAAVLVVSRSLTAFYAATVLTEILAVVTLGALLLGRGVLPRPRLAEFSPRLFREMLGFGVPMMIGYELSGTVLAVGDRYVIEALVGAEPLGLYSAAYNLCQYVQLVLVASVGQAIMPIYMQLWDRDGRAATAAFIDQSLRTYVLLGVPVVAGVAAVGPELLPALASSKYEAATVVLPWVIAGMVVDGTNPMVGAGLFIERRTRRIMAIVLSGAVLNLALNVILVPRIGIVGSAAATLVSYAVTSVLLAAAGRRILPVTLPWQTLGRAGAAAAIMYVAVADAYPGRGLATVLVRAVVGAAVYAAVMWAIDRDARAVLRGALGRGG